MPQLTDTHCHLNLEQFQEDLPAVIQRARDAGVMLMLVPGVDLPTSCSAVALAEQYDEVYAAVGVHPNAADQWNGVSLAELAKLADHPKVKAIGEIGLDYYWKTVPVEQQKAALQAQLKLAREKGLPVVLHQRESFEDLWEIVQPWQTSLCLNNEPTATRSGVFHSFDGSLEQARSIKENNFYVGISGPVTYKTAHDRHEMVTHLPLESLLIETDAPYLTPHPRRGERNEPGYTQFIAEKIASLRGLDCDELAAQTAANAARLFCWELSI